MSKLRLHRYRVGRAFVALVPLLLGLALADSASAQGPSKPSPEVVTWTDSAGAAHSLRALTAEEISARGLDKYIDMSKHAATTPQIQSVKDGVESAAKRPSGTVAPLASGCWSYWFGYGVFTWPELYGKTDVVWCGDGRWITYANSACYGYSNYPTYAYLGCSNFPNYGVGYNLYQVKSEWTLCSVWVPIWGTCSWTHKPWRQYQFLGDGRVLFNGGTT